MLLRRIDVQLGEQREAHRILGRAEALNLIGRARLLRSELIARKSEHLETLPVVLLIECFQLLVLRGQTTLRGNVDHQQHLTGVGFEGGVLTVDVLKFDLLERSRCDHSEGSCGQSDDADQAGNKGPIHEL